MTRRIVLIAAISLALAASSSSNAQSRRSTAQQASGSTSMQKLQNQVNALKQQVDALTAIVQLQGNNVTIQAPGRVRLRSSGGAVEIKGVSVKVEGQTSLLAKSASTRVESSGHTRIKGASVTLNNKSVTSPGALVTGVCPPTGGPLIAGKVMQ